MKNLVEMMQHHAAQVFGKDKYFILENSESQTEKLNYQALDQKARLIATYLQRKKLAGKCVLLIYPTGLEFITTFLGCLYAGAIAVPVSCPAIEEFEKSAQAISAIAKDADIAGILTKEEYFDVIRLHCKELVENNSIWLLSRNDLQKENINRYKLPKLTSESIAYLQYTSGSTSSSKGVKISHANLTHSLIATGEVWGYSKKSITLTWTPHAHVYGLVCGILVPLYHGTTGILISPAEFIKKPIFWLRLIDKYKVTHSGCPNFGYDVCIQQIKTDDCKNLNLSSWKVAVNGGEAVQHGTLKQFVELVAPFGFNPESFYLSYGMSEATGLIACKTYSAKQSKVEKSLHSRSDVNLGKVLSGLSAIIVDPEKRIILPDNEIGEICLQGFSITKGYWKKSEETKKAFFKNFLRTGDLGYVNEGEIFLTGRLKELLVVHGKKYFPLDLEMSSAESHENLISKNGCIVFSIDLNNKEEIIVAQEIKENGNTTLYEKTIKKIRSAISRDYQIDVYGVILLLANTLPRTNSGKLQRKLCQQKYLNQELSIIFSHYKSFPHKIYLEKDIDTKILEEQKSTDSSNLLKANLIQKIATILRIPPTEIDLEYHLIDYGFDSINITQLINGLNDDYGLGLTPNVLYEHKTLGDFFNFIASRSKKHSQQEEELDNLNANKLDEKTLNPKSFLKFDFIEKIASLLRVPSNEINLEYNLSEYGFDSITISQLITQLNENYYLNLTPAIFYEYKTLGDFLEFVLNKHTENFNQPLGSEKSSSSSSPKNEEILILESPSSPEAHVSFKQAIAIIGISGRFPGADDLEQFWELLDQQKNAITEIPADRWNHEHFPNRSKWGGFINDVDKFDASFFNISRHEAELMDPQQRLLLEATWKAIEDAGYAPDSLAGTNTGIYVGVSSSDYAELMQKNNIYDAHSVSGSAYCILANRISYLLDLQGPSLAVDTACSSSLVAIHHAIQAIQNGDCETAIAGGVNLLLTPRLFLAFSDSKMLSEDGYCKTFDDSANGYVRGEGVAAIFLKPLAKAIADNDHIYGVIKGSAINHGGHVKSLTVPNPNAQANLISSAIKQADVPLNTITYVEAHGTGTSVGDPIEMNGLIKAFISMAKNQNIHLSEQPFCGVGSVKTNIGHLEATAGAAGLIKVLLAMKNKKLPANIHFSKLNSSISLENTPFYIVAKTQPWKKLTDTDSGKPLPYRAGVSSFGFGGLNCHLIIEEAPKVEKAPNTLFKPYYLIGISAKNQTALQHKIKELHQWLQHSNADLALGQLAYILNIGRDHYTTRIAIVVDSIAALQNSLKLLLQGQVSESCISFPSSHEQENLTEQKLEIIYKQLKKQIEFTKQEFFSHLVFIAKFYLSGKNIDWKLLHYGEVNQKISLPTYPFIKERYWLNSALPKSELTEKIMDTFQDNYYVDLKFSDASTSGKAVFKIMLSGENFFLKDHIFNNESVLPGVAYVEIARVVATLVYPNKTVSKLKKISWLRPLIVKENEEVALFTHIHSLNNIVRFDIFSERENTSYLHAQGQISFSDDDLPTQEKLPLSEISQRMERRYLKEEIYKRMLGLIGFEYRHSFQVIEELYTNKTESLAKVVLPADMSKTLRYVLHPSVLDASIQAMIGLRLESGKHYQFLPFSVDEISIFKPLTSTVYVYGYMSEFKSSAQNQLYDIFIIDEQGNLLVKMKRIYARHADNSLNLFQAAKKSTHTASQEINFYQFPWRSQPITIPQHALHHQLSQINSIIIFSNNAINFNFLYTHFLQYHIKTIQVTFGEHYQIIENAKQYTIDPRQPSDYSQLIRDLRTINIFPTHLVYLPFDSLASESQPLATTKLLEQGIYSVFLFTQALLNAKLAKDIYLLYCYQTNDSAPFHSMISGFARTLLQENPRCHYQLVEVEKSMNMANAAEIIKQEIVNLAGEKLVLTRYIGTDRQVQISEPIVIKSDSNFNLKENSVCVIAGGMGGIGLIIAHYLAKRFKVRLALVGRSHLNEKNQTQLKSLAMLTSQVEYIQGDISNKHEAENIIHTIKIRFGNINSIFQSAGMTKDSIILKKELSDFEKVIAPKVLGTFYLDELTQHEPLDYFVLFSSAAGVLGNVGQSDYASANVFLDHFAAWRNQQTSHGRRQGHAISINWPVWEEGGLQVDEKTKAWMEKTKGLSAISTSTALEALNSVLRQKAEQVAVLVGDKEKIQHLLNITYPFKNAESHFKQVSPIIPNDVSLNQTIEALKILSAELLKADVNTIAIDKELSIYGLDSIIMLNMLSRIDEKYNISLLPTAFTEYPTIQSLAEHVLKEINQLDTEPQSSSPNIFSPTGAVKHPAEGMQSSTKFVKNEEGANQMDHRQAVYTLTSEKRNGMPARRKIAIIAAACRYPKSPTLEAYWDNLANERNLIQTDIPIERWDHSLYYHPDKSTPLKTYVKWAGLVDNIDLFDAHFFNIPEESAYTLDPVQRITLELAQELFDRAGYTRQEINGMPISVIIGGGHSKYTENFLRESLVKAPSQHIVNRIDNMIASRISDFYNLTAYSHSMDAACSASLLALHHACNSILLGDAEMAIAGGAECLLDPNMFIGFSKAGTLSDDGVCYVFDERAKGFVMGEGFGLILLKDYESAVRDGDRIMATILATASNNDGRTVGLTTPNGKAQQLAMQKALSSCGVSAETITYLEAHGTGTLLGDPIEIKAATDVYSSFTDAKNYCAVASVKSNLGHTLRAAGIASIIKVALALQNKFIPATLNCENPHPRFKFDKSPFYPNTKGQSWSGSFSHPRRAAVSAFAFGGTNVHAILEEHIQPEHLPVRSSLPLTQFNRKRYWLGGNQSDYKQIILQIASKQLDSASGAQMLRQKLSTPI